MRTLKLNYRAEIDGLRAFAVLSIVFFHTFPGGMTGGFVGVDIFFVISGFLISNNIFKKLHAGKFNYFEFFGRRILRIFPALIVIMASSMVFGWFALFGDEYTQLGKHIFGGAAFISNFVYAEESIAYLTDDNETKPMLHLWSLAVEEQFYIVWPLILWIGWKLKQNLFGITLFTIVISFCLNLWFIDSRPIETFYWPFTRFWELLSGAALAWLLLNRGTPLIKTRQWKNHSPTEDKQHHEEVSIGTPIANCLSLFGLLLITFGVFWIDEGMEYPSAWALFPVLGALSVISAGSKAWLNRIILMNPLAVWFGLISYPLYLWHWPILSFLHIIEGPLVQRELQLGAIFLSILLAWITYKLIETPFRRTSKPVLSVPVLVVSLVVLGLSGKYIELNDGLPIRLLHFAQQNKEILQQLKSAGKLRETKTCRKYFKGFKKGLCVFEEKGAPTVLLFGDSHALHFYKGLRNSLANEKIVVLGGGWGKRFGRALNPLITGRSRPLSDEVYTQIENNESIHTVIVAHRAGKDGSDSYLKTFDFLTSLGKRVVYVYDIPQVDFDLKKCVTTRPVTLSSKPQHICSTPKNKALKPLMAYRKNVEKALANRPSVISFDTIKVLCDETDCFAKIDGKLLYSNKGANPHLSTDGELLLGRKLGEHIIQHLK